MENNWFWVADHDIDDQESKQITVFAGRGLLIESKNGGNVLYGTSVEHHQLYEYNLASTRDTILVRYVGFHFQPTFSPSSSFHRL